MKTNDRSLKHELDFARQLVVEAGTLALALQKRENPVELKLDGTLVSKADRTVQDFMIDSILRTFPEDHILAEEESEKLVPLMQRGSDGRRCWIIDPIDGTASYVRDIPFWSTLLALEIDSEVAVGAVYAPTQSVLYYAAEGEGAYKNGIRIHASACTMLSEAQLNFGELNLVSNAGVKEGFNKLVDLTARQRGYGDYLGPAMVFEGKAEIMIEPLGKPWDFAPMKILAKESGAIFRDLAGHQSIYGGGCFIASQGIAEQAYQTLMSNQRSVA